MRRATFKNVLVGVDGRSHGRDAIALADRLIDRSDGGAKLTLAHVRPGPLGRSYGLRAEIARDHREASEELLSRERMLAGVDAELLSVIAATPGRGLHEQTERQGADLLVVGSCARGAVGRVMLGNDTAAALNGAPCAVAVAAHGYAQHPTPLARIGVGYDERAESSAALALALELAARSRASVHALEVVQLPTYSYSGLAVPPLGERIEEMLEKANKRLSGLAGVDARARYGLCGKELAAFSDEVDVLIVGSRGYGPLRRLVLGSTSSYLQRHARCSLIVLPRSVAREQRDGEAEAGARAAAAA
jgi:nucleotide-binding universal stress UspA family protein